MSKEEKENFKLYASYDDSHVKYSKKKNKRNVQKYNYIKIAQLWMVLASILLFRLSVMSLLLTLWYFINREKSHSKYQNQFRATHLIFI